MQYSKIDNLKFFILRHHKFVVTILSVFIVGVLVYCFNDGYANRVPSNEFSEIQNFVLELRDKDKKIINPLKVNLIKKNVKGIDVSEFQGDIDWEKVKNTGIDFVMIRCGYRSMVKGEVREDSKFRYNISEANRLGIPVGVYFYSTAINKKEAIEEASFVLNLIKDYDVIYPVVYDFEMFDENRTKGLNDKVVNDNAIYFLDYVRSHGYHGMMYANLRSLKNHWNIENFMGYALWYAQYIDMATYEGEYAMWQYADNGRVDGIVGNVDLDEGYVAYEVVTN